MLFLAARISPATRVHVDGRSSGELFELRKKIVQKVFESNDGRVLLPSLLFSKTALSLLSQKHVDAKPDQASKLQPLRAPSSLDLSLFLRGSRRARERSS